MVPYRAHIHIQCIEGNTLSRAETALVVEKGLTMDGKTLQEQLEAVNHAHAFDWVMQTIRTGDKDITENTILDLHELILQKIDTTNAGRYRSVPVRIAGSTVVMLNPLKVPALTKEFVAWVRDAKAHSVSLAIDAHYQLVSIHPFTNGNGKTARLLMNMLLMQAGYPPPLSEKKIGNNIFLELKRLSLAVHWPIITHGCMKL